MKRAILQFIRNMQSELEVCITYRAFAKIHNVAIIWGVNYLREWENYYDFT
jgi:hypothetical protein